MICPPHLIPLTMVFNGLKASSLWWFGTGDRRETLWDTPAAIYCVTPADLREHYLLHALSASLFITDGASVLRFDPIPLLSTIRLMKDNKDQAMVLQAILGHQRPWTDLGAYVERWIEVLEPLRIVSLAGIAGGEPFLHGSWERIALSQEERHAWLPAFFERETYSISLAAYDLMRELDIGAARRMRRATDRLRQFEGWTLCIPDKFYTTMLTKFFVTWDAEVGEILPTASAVGGRPPVLIEKVRLALQSLYPDGDRGPDSWKKVRQRVMDQLGHDASVDTVRRAIREVQEAAKLDA